MNKKKKKIYNKVVSKPTRADVTFDEVKSLLVGEGSIFKKGDGSRVKFIYKKQILAIHKPHPKKVLPKYAVERIREFLIITGIEP